MIAEDIQLRTDLVEKMSTRREARRARRNRKTRYRKPRFNNRLKEIYPDKEVQNTYGYLTKNKRIQLGLQKEHYNNAYCIAGNLESKPIEEVIHKKKVRRYNRQIHKFNILKSGKRKLNQASFEVKGFRLWDKVVFENQECFIAARRVTGYFSLRELDGKMINVSASWKKLVLLERANGHIIERRARPS